MTNENWIYTVLILNFSYKNIIKWATLDLKIALKKESHSVLSLEQE